MATDQPRNTDGRFGSNNGPRSADTVIEKIALVEKRIMRRQLRVDRYERELNILKVERDQQTLARRRAPVEKRILLVEQKLLELREQLAELTSEKIELLSEVKNG